jgi:tetrahydromethanopterin S-methyltransferase subunit G
VFLSLLAAVLLCVASYQAFRRIESRSDAVAEQLCDVVSDFQSSSRETAEQIGSISNPVEIDLTPISYRLEKVEQTVAELAQRQVLHAQKLERRLGKLTAAVEDIPYPLHQNPVSLEPVNERLESIEKELAGIGQIMGGKSLSGQPVITGHKLIPDE